MKKELNMSLANFCKATNKEKNETKRKKFSFPEIRITGFEDIELALWASAATFLLLTILF